MMNAAKLTQMIIAGFGERLVMVRFSSTRKSGL